MTERPILFSGPMVRAILDGRKTQTRRIFKPDGKYRLSLVIPPGGGPPRCPYGAPGDRLWVRETWQEFFRDEVPDDRPCGPEGLMGIPAEPDRKAFVFYRADGELPHKETGAPANWLPSTHMPRWASRLTLEVVSVRVERLQEISESDAEAEGVDRIRDKVPLHRDSFRYLWDSINAKRAPWESNPWVWVIEFKRIK